MVDDQISVWTGKEMVAATPAGVLVWGGVSAVPVPGGGYQVETRGDGFPLSPRTRRWRRMSSAGAPSARVHPASVWTEHGLVVGGGVTRTTRLHHDDCYEPGRCDIAADGAIYDPGTDTWKPMSMAAFPEPSGRPQGGNAAFEYERPALYAQGRHTVLMGRREAMVYDLPVDPRPHDRDMAHRRAPLRRHAGQAGSRPGALGVDR